MMSKSSIAATGMFLLSCSLPLAAAPSEQSWQAFNTAVVSQHILPGYQQLTASTEQLKGSITELCQATSDQKLQQSRQAFQQAMASWQAIQHVQFGPIETLMRNFSMQFWPDKKNLTSKQLNALLKAEDNDSLSPEQMRGASIAVKGLPALERLLFAQDALDQYQQHPYRCQLSQAVANNVATMSADTLHEWQQYQQEFTQLDGNGYYEDTTEASTDLLKTLVEPVEVIRDLKVLRPLGKSFDKSKPRRAESWRSERSIENIIINLQTLQALYNTGAENSARALLAAEGEKQTAEQIDQVFSQIITKLQALPTPMRSTLEQQQSYQQLDEISTEMKALHFALTAAMQPLDIQLGFNSRDGD